MEATIEFIPPRGLKFSLNAAYTDPTLTVDSPPPSNGKKGDRLPYIPKWNLNLNGDYDFPLTAGWNGFVGATYQYVGERHVGLHVHRHAGAPACRPTTRSTCAPA